MGSTWEASMDLNSSKNVPKNRTTGRVLTLPHQEETNLDLFSHLSCINLPISPNGSWSPKEERIPLIPCTSTFHCLKKLCHVYVNTSCIYTSYFVAVDMRGM